MNDPEFREQAGLYELIWGPPEDVYVRVDRIHTDRTGVICELLIRSTAPGAKHHLHGPVRFNLTASTRKPIIESLNQRVILDWASILETVCYLVVEAHRLGEPAINIASYEMPERIGMRIAPLLQEKQPTIIFGEGDSLKSYLATYLAVLTRAGMPHSGLNPEPGNVLYLDYEEETDIFWERVNMICAGLEIAIPDGIFHRRMVEPLAADFKGVNKIVAEQQIDLVIIDSAAPATLEPEKAEMVIPYFKVLRALKVTTLTIAHQTKAKAEYPFGSIMWWNLPRSLFLAKADRHEGDVAMSLKDKKGNNRFKLMPMGFSFHFEEDSVTVSKANAADYEDLAKDIPVRERILEMLVQPMTIPEIADALAVETETVGVALRRGKGKVFFQNGHTWAKLYVR